LVLWDLAATPPRPAINRNFFASFFAKKEVFAYTLTFCPEFDFFAKIAMNSAMNGVFF
jgi:hypothetical protein